jgi:hypothetical protein
MAVQTSRDQGRKLAADQLDRLEVVVKEVFENDTLTAGLPDSPQPLGRLLDRADRPAVARLLKHLGDAAAPNRSPIRRADSRTAVSSRPITHDAITE